MERRKFIAGAGAAAVWPGVAIGQQATKVYRIGYLGPGSRAPIVDEFVDELRRLGYVEGQNVFLDFQFAAGKVERLPEMVADYVQRKVDVIVAASTLAAIPALRATRTIPIIGLGVHDGVGAGLWTSLAHPGGNVTGLEALAPEIDAKRVEILKEIFPHLSRITVLYNPIVPGSSAHLKYVMEAGNVVGAAVRVAEVQSPADFDAGFAAIQRDRPDAVLVVTDPLTFQERKRIDGFATEHRIPVAYEFKQLLQQGGLVSYGPSLGGMWRRGAHYVDKIFKGAKPADLPVEQPTKFELVINLKTAKALGLTIPPALFARVDEVIE
jgi:putative ABC transport system substrate-binding protein